MPSCWKAESSAIWGQSSWFWTQKLTASISSAEHDPGGGEAVPWWCVCHPCIGARSHQSIFQKGSSVWRRCLGSFGQQGTDRNWKVSTLPQKCPLPTLHACSVCVKLPTLVTHTRGSSAPAWEAQFAVLQLFYLWITTLAFNCSPCSEHSHPSFFPKLPGHSSSLACRQLVLVAAVSGKGLLAGTETPWGFGSC